MACNATLTGITRKDVCDTNVLGSVKNIYLRPFSEDDKDTLAEYSKFELNTDKGSVNEEINGDRTGGVFIAQTVEMQLLESEDEAQRALDIAEFNKLIKVPYLDAVVEFLDGTQQHLGFYNGMTVTGGSRATGMTRQEGRTNAITLSGEEPTFSEIVTLV